MDTIFVKHVKEDSPAEKAGLKTGDRILSVNNTSVAGKSYAQVISLVQSSNESLLKLNVLPKEQDILQMAYKGTGGNLMKSEPSLCHSRSNTSSNQSPFKVNPPQPSFSLAATSSTENVSYRDPVNSYLGNRERRMSASSVEDNNNGGEDRRYLSTEKGRKMKSSTSYTSGLSIAPQIRSNVSGSDIYKYSFSEKRKQFEASTKENMGQQPRTYSLGLYYPTSSKDEKVSSSDSLAGRTGSLYWKSVDNILQSNDSLENVSRSLTVRPQSRVLPFEQKTQATDTNHRGITTSSTSPSFSSSPSRHSYPEPSPALANQIAGLSRSQTSNENMGDEGSKRTEIHSTRHYVPVVSQSSTHTKLSASVDGLDSHSGQFLSERNVRPNYNQRFHDSQNQGGSSRTTFIVKIGDKTIETDSSGHSNGQMSSSTTVQVPGSYGTAFALTKSPVSTQIEIKQKSDNRPFVQHRKKQFENGKNENTSPSGNFNRYKTEIKKITSQGKFTSVENRLRNFEKNPDGTIRIRRLSSSEGSRYSSPEPSSSGSAHSSRSASEQRGTPQPQYQESAPIRIYVSQGNSNSSSSPIVEILQMPVYQDNREGMANYQDSKAPEHVSGDMIDGQNLEGDSIDEPRGHKPIRKHSFLSAVSPKHHSNQFCPQSPSEEMTCPDSPSTSSWHGTHVSMATGGNTTMTSYSSISSALMPPPSTVDGLTLTSTPIKDSSPTVKLRKKSESTAEEDAIKLQRRTSYLMATAKDRDSHKLSLDKSASPNQSGQDLQLQLTPHKHHPSMKKLKAFFGEKTPKILEAAIERKPDPASPLQEVEKEGTLYYKTDITDGKRSSDRSWRPVWVELRGHALYLHKERKEPGMTHPFTFEDQPISIKSCIVDIAYDYTKKKNVFRLKTYNGSEYLFQTDDQEGMIGWISAIQKNNNPDSDEQGLVNVDFILRKSSQAETQSVSTSSLKTSPQAPPKTSKKLSGISLKYPKIPSSPSTKRKKTDDASKSKTFKGKLKNLRKHPLGGSSLGSSDDMEVSAMFGVPLECAIPSPNNEFVPMIVDLCTKIIEARGLEVTGVYRVPGNTAAVNMMQEELNKGIDNMNVDHEKWCDVNVISSLLKAFFRKLPEPLITTDLYQSFVNANRIEDPERRMLKLKRLLHALPEHHFETFKHLAEHLNKVASMGCINKMDSRNLALMFGPTLIRQKDDNMSTIIQDMSDQCRIVESVILHYDWFFGSWDQDSYVPVDEKEEGEHQPPSNTTVSKMTCGDDVNPKDIVSSIVQAANRKLRGEVDSTSFQEAHYQERDIDKEIRKHNMIKVETTRSSPNLTGLSIKPPQEQQVVIRKSESSVDGRRMAKSQEIIDSDWDYVDSDNRQSQSMYINARHFSEDSLDKNDEMEMSHSGLSGQYSMSGDTLDRLRKIEEEARALREKEEKRRRDFERRKLEKQKLEQDIQRTRKEIEIEDSQNVDDLLNAPSGHMWHSTSELQHFSGGSSRIDSTSVTSDYSSTSSGASSRLKNGNLSDYSTAGSPSDLAQGRSRRDHAHGDQGSGGKYFVIQTSKVPPAKRTNSLETMLEDSDFLKYFPQGKTTKLSSKRKEDKPPQWAIRHSRENVRRSRGNLSRSNSVRHGSLDSLIDLRDKYEVKSTSNASSDSEDGSDLLSDLTSTFDQKLQVLVNPKYKLHGTGNRLNKSEGCTPSSSEHVEHVSNNAHAKLPPQLPLSLVNKYGLCSSNDMLEKQFRDPSLHRTPSQKGEAKVGIAYRFERNTSNSAIASGSRDNTPSSSGSTSSASVVLAASDPRTSYLTVNTSPVATIENRSKPSSYLTSPKLYLIQPSSPKFDYGNSKDTSRPISKSEKTEANVSLSKQTTRDTGHTSTKETTQTTDFKARSTSPEPVKKKSEKKCKKRRHTVGGTCEEHINALCSLEQSKESTKMSAWERLQPVVKDSDSCANRSLLSWLQHERLRGSVPDLSVTCNSSFKYT